MKRPRTIRILGIDPGSRVTGFGVIDYAGSEFEVVEHGSIRTPKDSDFPERLEAIYNGLLEVIERCEPEVAAVETTFSGLNPRSLIQLSHARGVILLAVRTAGLQVFEYSPRSVKSAVVGYGGAEKQQVAKMVRLLVKDLGTAKLGSDAADALAIAICHAHSSGLASRARET